MSNTNIVRLEGDIEPADIWGDGHITPDSIEKLLNDNKAKGTINLLLSSCGGSTYAGINIFNTINLFKKANPNVTLNLIINDFVASAASYIACADFDNRYCFDNSTVMIHNPWTYAIGNAKELGKSIEILESLENEYINTYAKILSIDRDIVRQHMDDEKFYVGQEIIDIGFAQSFYNDSSLYDDGMKASILKNAIMAKARKEILMSNANNKPENADAPNGAENAENAENPNAENTENPNAESADDDNTNETPEITIDYIKANYPLVYDAIYKIGLADGETLAKDQAKADLDNHAFWINKVGAAAVLNNIQSNIEYNQNAIDSYHEIIAEKINPTNGSGIDAKDLIGGGNKNPTDTDSLVASLQQRSKHINKQTK